jgi:hypothetical protein
VLVFEDGGETIFTKGEVVVQSPGGTETNGSFEKVVNTFFGRYFTQAFLKTSGLYEHLNNPKVYKQNLAAGKTMGRSKGLQVGYRWIANAGIR